MPERLNVQFGPKEYHDFLTLEVEFNVLEFALDERRTLGVYRPGDYPPGVDQHIVIGKNLDTGELVIVPPEYKNARLSKACKFQTREEAGDIKMSPGYQAIIDQAKG